MTKNAELKICPICGCTEHKLIGCITHWNNHKKNIEGRCKMLDER